jgi:hypothetical protein
MEMSPFVREGQHIRRLSGSQQIYGEDAGDDGQGCEVDVPSYCKRVMYHKRFIAPDYHEGAIENIQIETALLHPAPVVVVTYVGWLTKARRKKLAASLILEL